MPLDVRVDDLTGTAIGTATGQLTVDEIIAAVRSLPNHPAFAGKASLWDLRACTFSFSADQVHQLAVFSKSGGVYRPPARLAFVVERDFEYGLVRMFEAYRDEPGVEVMAFRDYDQAVAWLADGLERDP